MGNDRVFDGEIKQGFGKWRLRERELATGETTVEIVKTKRMHKFGSGYQDTGRSLPVTHELTRRDARAVRDLLDDWLERGQCDE